MSKKQKKIRKGIVNTLRKAVEYHNDLYYNQNAPEISDEEYDRLVKKLKGWEEKYKDVRDKDSPTQKVSVDRDTYFVKRKHKYQMYSLDNAFEEEDLDKFFSNLPDLTFALEDKVDGLSLEVQYVSGKVTRAITRGDGIYGDDVTENALKIVNLPLKIDPRFTGSIFGEVCIYKEKFEEINHKATKKYANARNLAAGTLKSHDPEIVKERGLKFIAYNIRSTKKVKTGHDSQVGKLQWLMKRGFTTPTYDYTKSREIMKVLKMFEERRDSLPYEVDGVVIKLNDFNRQEEIGYSTRAPKWAIAWKFASEQAITTLEDIIFNVGRSGVVTPVAVLTPVKISGSTVSRATLHNKDFIKDLNLTIGCEVRVEKSGEIIPKILEVVNHQADAELYKFPENCPICDSILYKKEGDVKWYCPDTFNLCTQFQEKMFHFASKPALDIQGLGEEVIKTLIKEGFIRDFTSIFNTDFDKIAQLEGFGERSAEKLRNSIELSKQKPMDKWLFALGIPGIGAINANNLCNAFPTWHKLTRATKEDIMKLDGFGEVMATNITEYFADAENRRVIRMLKRHGMPKRVVNTNIETTGTLNGMKIAVTGTIPGYKRNEVSNLIESNGGTFHNRVTKTTDMLIIGERAGKSKVSQAAKLITPILSYAEFKTKYNITSL